MTTFPSQSVLADGTILGRVIAGGFDDFSPNGACLRLALPLPLPATTTLGAYFLARCVPAATDSRRDEWGIYARRPLFSVGPPVALPDRDETVWDLFLPSSPADPGYRWLRACVDDTPVNVLGPFGRQFEFAGYHRTLLIVSDTDSLATTLPAMHAMLDRGGRVALVWWLHDRALSALVNRLPIPVEVRMAHTLTEWRQHLADTLRWSDCLLAAFRPQTTPGAASSPDYHTLAHLIRSHRYRLEPGYAHALVQADLLCGFGACLACVVPTPDGGQTRACLHGPLFPLEAIARG